MARQVPDTLRKAASHCRPPNAAACLLQGPGAQKGKPQDRLGATAKVQRATSCLTKLAGSCRLTEVVCRAASASRSSPGSRPLLSRPLPRLASRVAGEQRSQSKGELRLLSSASETRLTSDSWLGYRRKPAIGRPGPKAAESVRVTIVNQQVSARHTRVALHRYADPDTSLLQQARPVQRMAMPVGFVTAGGPVQQQRQYQQPGARQSAAAARQSAAYATQVLPAARVALPDCNLAQPALIALSLSLSLSLSAPLRARARVFVCVCVCASLTLSAACRSQHRHEHRRTRRSRPGRRWRFYETMLRGATPSQATTQACAWTSTPPMQPPGRAL